MQGYVLISIIIICVSILAIALIKNKMEIFINFILRTVAGIVGIYFFNMILGYKGIYDIVGINGITVLSVGLLGIPGFVLMYSVAIYHMLKG